MYDIIYNKPNIAKILIEKNACLDYKNGEDDTALNMLIFNNRKKYLI